MTPSVLERRQTGVLRTVPTSVFRPFWWSQADLEWKCQLDEATQSYHVRTNLDEVMLVEPLR